MKLILHFIKPYRWMCLAAAFTVLFDVTGALLIPTITADMINIGVAGGDIRTIIYRGILMLAISLVTGLSALLGSWICARISARVGRDIRNAVYDKSLTLSSSDFEYFGTATMITRTLSDINTIQQSLVMFIQMILPVPVMCIMGVIFSFRIHRHMGFLILGIMGFLMLITTVIVRNAAPIMERLQRFLDRMNVVLRETITGVRVIRAFNREAHEAERTGKTFSDYADSAIKVNCLFAGLDSLALVTVNLCIVAILYLGGNSVGSGAMSIGDISAVTEYAIWILYYMIMAQMVIILMPRALVCLHRVSEILSYTPEIVDGDGRLDRTDGLRSTSGSDSDDDLNGASSLNGAGGLDGTSSSHSTSDLSDTGDLNGTSDSNGVGSLDHTDNLDNTGGLGLTGTNSPNCTCRPNTSGSPAAPARPRTPGEILRFDRVTFRFADADENTLNDISFVCRRGETTAIIGGTGSGKSTIAKLLMRYHDVSAGQICFHGSDLRELPQGQLRRHISYVPQKAWLFSDTIEDNLRYGNPDAGEEELYHALQVAQSEFVRELPDGLRTYVAQGGTNFSGGQKQRLSIARALAKKADLYVFDDSFSALDFKTDAALRQALSQEVRDAAVLIIAQRVSTIVKADQIIVLDDGRIAGIGTHSQLLEHCPLYQDIAKSQMKGGDLHG